MFYCVHFVNYYSLQHAQSEMGRCRAWIRLAVNECALENYINVLCQDESLLRYVCMYVPVCICVYVCPTTVHVLLMGEVQVGLQMPTPSPWSMAQSHLQGTSLPPGGFARTTHSTCLVYRQPSDCLKVGLFMYVCV